MPKQIKTEDLINGVVKMKIEKGASNKTILDFLQNDIGYGLTYSYEIMKKARVKIQEIWDKNTEAHLEEAKGQLEEMLESALRNKNVKLALSIRQEINKLMGLYAAEKIEVSGLKDITINIVNPIEKKEDKNETESD
jgi:hypothetical protein